VGWFIFTVVAITALIIVGVISNRASGQSMGYYDTTGRKIPLDDIYYRAMNQDTEISRLKERLETEKQQSSSLLQRLEELEKRLEVLEKRGS
jgi:archaellum component FlaC